MYGNKTTRETYGINQDVQFVTRDDDLWFMRWSGRRDFRRSFLYPIQRFFCRGGWQDPVCRYRWGRRFRSMCWGVRVDIAVEVDVRVGRSNSHSTSRPQWFFRVYHHPLSLFSYRIRHHHSLSPCIVFPFFSTPSFSPISPCAAVGQGITRSTGGRGVDGREDLGESLSERVDDPIPCIYTSNEYTIIPYLDPSLHRRRRGELLVWARVDLGLAR
jgi:hypothetical protein